MGIQLSGLASGFDWKSVVDQLMTLEAEPQNKLRTEQTANTTKLSAFTALRTRLTALQDAANNLKGDALFSQRTVSLANSDLGWTASAGNGATAGEYAFDVTKLATRARRDGGVDVAAALNDSGDVSSLLVSELRTSTAVTAGTFTINGKKVVVGDTDTLADVFQKINDATGGTVTASYDHTTDRVTLSGSAPLSLGGSGDTSNFLFALKLHNNTTASVSSSTTLGTVALRDDIVSTGLGAAITAVDGDGKGTFSVNGVSIDYNVNTDSIQSVMSRVNSSAAGVTMSYDASTDRFKFTNNDTGDLGLVVSEASGGLLDALKLGSGGTFVSGTNAEFSVNGGGTIISASNSLAAGDHGVTGLTVNATSLGEQTITVASDSVSLKKGIETFISKFNDVQAFIDTQTKVTVAKGGKVTAALLANNREVTTIARELRNTVFSEVPGLTGTIRRLEAIGIDFEGSDSQLSVRDSSKLDDAIANSGAQVSALFTTASFGMSAKLDTYVTRLTATGGLLAAQETSFERQNTSIDTQIADWDRRLAAERSRLESSFIRMEQAQSQMQSQLASLNNILG